MTGSTATVYEYDIPTKSVDAAPVATLPFKIRASEDRTDWFVLRRPKMSIAMGMVQLVEQQDEFTPTDFGIRLSQLLWGFVHYVQAETPHPAKLPNPDYDPDDDAKDAEPKFLDEPNPLAGELRGRGRLLQRLNDPEDDMDITDLEPMFRQMITVMFDRPTGPSPESPMLPGDGGTDSAVPTPVKRAKTSGNSRPASSSQRARTSSAKGTKRG